MPEKKRRLIDDLLQDDFFGIKSEKKEETLFEEDEEEEKSVEETTINKGELFEDGLIEEEPHEEIKGESEAPKEEEAVEETRKKSSGIFILILFLIIIGGGVAGYFFITKNKFPSSPAPLKIIDKAAAPEKVKNSMEKNKKVVKSSTIPVTPVVATKKVTATTVSAPKITSRTHQKSDQLEKKNNKVVAVKETKETPSPYVSMPKYSLRAGPMDVNEAVRWEKKLIKAGWQVNRYFTEEKESLFFIDLGILDKSKAMAQKLKIELFMPDQKGKIKLEPAGRNNVKIILGPYSSAVIANSVIQRLKTPKLNIEGKLFTKFVSTKKYFLKIGKFTRRNDAEKVLEKFRSIGLKVEITGL